MVTTRSADKATPVKTKAENLTLRSRPLDTEIAAPSSTSAKKKSNIIVNVPPPRKRTRLSSGAADGPEDTIVVAISDTTRTEIPDSQDSPLKPAVAENSHTEVEFTVPGKGESVTSTKRKRKADATPTSTPRKPKSEATPTSGGKHRRFGSEDPLDDPTPGDNDEDNASVQRVEEESHVQSDDESDAPEVATTKSTSTLPSQKKRRAGKKPTSDSANDKLTSSTLAQSQSPSKGPATNQAEAIEVNTTPVVKLDTAQHKLLEDDEHSQASTDTPFVTARPYRHFDAFETPKSSHTPIPLHSNSHRSLVHLSAGKDEEAPSKRNNDISDLSGLAISRSKTKSTTEVSSSAKLPQKASNPLEGYRRQMVRNRVKGKGRFKLQEHWSGKRGKFVIGF